MSSVVVHNIQQQVDKHARTYRFFHDGTKPFTCDADPLKLNCYGWLKLRPQSMLFLSLALSPVSVIILISRRTSNQCPKWSTQSSGSLVPLAHSSVNNSFPSPVAYRQYWLFDWHEIPSSTDCHRCLVLQQCVAKVNYSTFNKARNYTIKAGPVTCVCTKAPYQYHGYVYVPKQSPRKHPLRRHNHFQKPIDDHFTFCGVLVFSCAHEIFPFLKLFH